MRCLILLILFFFAVSRPALAYRFSGGVILGDPTGFTLKNFVSEIQAFDFGIAYTFSNFFLLYGDYLFHFPHLLANHHSQFVQQLVPYLGGGIVFFASETGPSPTRRYLGPSSSSIGVGVRFSFGVEWKSRLPLGVFVELAPGVGLVPGTFSFLEGGVGARLYFDEL